MSHEGSRREAAPIDLARLADAAREGGESSSRAERRICAHFGPALLLFGRRHLRDVHAAEDLAQETMRVVIEAVRAGRVEDPRRLGSFVYGVARNKLREGARAARRRRRIVEETPEPAPYEPVLIGWRMHLFACLAQLTQRTRVVLARTYFEEETAAEIGEQMGLSTGNVRIIRHRALGALRRCLEGES